MQNVGLEWDESPNNKFGKPLCPVLVEPEDYQSVSGGWRNICQSLCTHFWALRGELC